MRGRYLARLSEDKAGREKEIALVMSNIKKGKQISICGPDGSGKTWMMEQVARKLSSSYVPVYFSFSPLYVNGEEDFVKLFCKKVLRGYDMDKGWWSLPLMELDRELKRLKASNAIREKIRLVVAYQSDKVDMQKVVAAAVDLPELLSAETGKRCVLLLDDMSERDMELVRHVGRHSHTSVVWASEREITEAVWLGEPLYHLMGKEELQERLFVEKTNRLSGKERLILFAMAEQDINTPSAISRVILYSQTSIRRFLTIMEEKGFVRQIGRGHFEILDKKMKDWLKKKRSER